ncbi:hypothetical protein Moror_5549 [Moniliophthora roreri MCA 2997]|uniref:Extracellular membrane protein CFEM domain-containing protein n=1 Tax=Moniliophthora roreri (strain MCA 2997) TaxID=1381753 RepID=V2X5W1_MONRO|nr:hypothetical protein Moror_5549 [Moniliophthora roreri MCA 2997]
MLVNPSLLLLALSTFSGFVLAFPNLQARQDEGFEYPFQCKAQCEATDTEILRCGNDAACLCDDLLLTSSATCFSCVASVQPETTEALQGVLDQATIACTNAGFDVTPQIITASGDGDENSEITNIFANMPQTGIRSNLKCQLPCDLFQATLNRCDVAQTDCLCAQTNVDLLASCFNCAAREEKNSTVTSGLQDVMNALSEQCTAVGFPLIPATISEGAASNSSPNSSIPGDTQSQDIFTKLPETSERTNLKCQLSCSLLAPAISCDSIECSCTQGNIDKLTGCFNCRAREENNSTATTGFQDVMNGIIDQCSASGINLTAGTISDGTSSNSSSASSSATPVSLSVSSTSALSTISPTSLGATASASATSLPGNTLPAEDNTGNGALSSGRINTSIIVGVGIGMAALLV